MDDARAYYEKKALEANRYTEDPTDDELLGVEMFGVFDDDDGLEKARTHTYTSRKRNQG